MVIFFPQKNDLEVFSWINYMSISTNLTQQVLMMKHCTLFVYQIRYFAGLKKRERKYKNDKKTNKMIIILSMNSSVSFNKFSFSCHPVQTAYPPDLVFNCFLFFWLITFL